MVQPRRETAQYGEILRVPYWRLYVRVGLLAARVSGSKWAGNYVEEGCIYWFIGCYLGVLMLNAFWGMGFE